MSWLFRWISDSLSGKAGIKEIWEIAYPLIISTASGTVMMFADRMFLSHYSKEALAASAPAGITTFMCVSLFFGITGYVNSMVAQNYGADMPDRCGAIAWQGLYVSLIGYVLLLLAAPLVADATHIIFSGALRGAGDTRFLMWNAIVLHMFLVMVGRFRGERWSTIKLISDS